MYTVRENTTLVGVSELRNKIDKILEKARSHRIVIEKRNKPLAVLITIDEYELMEGLLDRIEDYELGRIAGEREKKSSMKDYITLEKALRKV
jgi:prevent-host-death family protein